MPQLIGRAIAKALLHACTRHPGGEPIGIVIAPARAFLESRHAAELRHPNHKRVVQQPPLPQVTDQRRRRLVKDRRMNVILLFELSMPIPVADPLAHRIRAIEKLNAAHVPLQQTTREDAVLGKAALHRIWIVCSVSLQGRSGLTRQITHLQHAELHFRRQLVTRDAGRQLEVARELLKVRLVEPLQHITRRHIARMRNTRWCRQVVNRLPRIEGGALEHRRQEAIRPMIHPRLRHAARIRNRNERRQVIRF